MLYSSILLSSWKLFKIKWAFERITENDLLIYFPRTITSVRGSKINALDLRISVAIKINLKI